MSKFFVLFAIFAMAAAAACAVVGCGDRSIEGLDAGGSIDAPYDTSTVYGEIEPDESPPDDSKQEYDDEIPDNLDPWTVCGPYLGLWDCTSIKGGHIYKLIEFFLLNEYTMQFAVQIIGMDGFDIVTCNPQHMPPCDDATSSIFYQLQPDGKLKIDVTGGPSPAFQEVYFCTISP